MGFLRRLFGGGERHEEYQPQPQQPYPRQSGSLSDEQAIERYRYMLRTAPPEDVERAHAEAFATLTPEQRRMVLRQLSEQVPPGERARSDDPQSLARMATRAEMRQPGIMERTFGGYGGGGMGMGMGMGGMLAGGFMATLAGSFVGTAIAQSFFDNDAGFGEGYSEGYQDANAEGDVADGQGADVQEDYAGGAGADFGDGGDFGGGGEF